MAEIANAKSGMVRKVVDPMDTFDKVVQADALRFFQTAPARPGAVIRDIFGRTISHSSRSGLYLGT